MINIQCIIDACHSCNYHSFPPSHMEYTIPVIIYSYHTIEQHPVIAYSYHTIEQHPVIIYSYHKKEQHPVIAYSYHTIEQTSHWSHTVFTQSSRHPVIAYSYHTIVQASQWLHTVITQSSRHPKIKVWSSKSEDEPRPISANFNLDPQGKNMFQKNAITLRLRSPYCSIVLMGICWLSPLDVCLIVCILCWWGFADYLLLMFVLLFCCVDGDLLIISSWCLSYCSVVLMGISWLSPVDVCLIFLLCWWGFVDYILLMFVLFFCCVAEDLLIFSCLCLSYCSVVLMGIFLLSTVDAQAWSSIKIVIGVRIFS